MTEAAEGAHYVGLTVQIHGLGGEADPQNVRARVRRAVQREFAELEEDDVDVEVEETAP